MMSDVSSLRCSTTITCVGPIARLWHGPGFGEVNEAGLPDREPVGHLALTYPQLEPTWPNFEPEHPLASFDILHGNNIEQIHE